MPQRPTALLTGATSDTGLAIARQLLTAGATVHALGRRLERLDALNPALEAGGDLVGHMVDLRDQEAVSDLVAAIGSVDWLVLNAAHPAEQAPLLVGGLSNLRTVMETNFFAHAHVIERMLTAWVATRQDGQEKPPAETGAPERGMVTDVLDTGPYGQPVGGRVVHISSLAATIGEAHGPGYCASKAAMDSLLRNLAIDYSPLGITFNSIEAGPLETERMARWGASKARRMASAAAVRRLGQPEDVAAAVGYLVSPGAAFVTGETLRVGGGLHLGNPLAAMYVREGRTSQGAPGRAAQP